MRDYYIFSSGSIKRKDNSLIFESEETKHPIPVEDVENIYFFGDITLNTRFLNFVGRHGITIHVFNYYGFYSGSFYPRTTLNSGALLVEQVRHYLSKEKRVELAREILKSASFNILHNLKYYNKRERDLADTIKRIEHLRERFDYEDTIPSLMAIEGNIRDLYYNAFPLIITAQKIEFKKRVKHPPDNMLNSLISFLNSLVYTTVLSEIYRTQLNPLISFLHEPGERRFSLALDVAEIFKPLLADRLLFSLLNKKQITQKDFKKETGFTILKEPAKKLIVNEYDKRLKTTVKHRGLRRSVSYRRLIRLELYKLIKHLIGEKLYKGFKIWW